jgi:signal peptidase I
MDDTGPSSGSASLVQASLDIGRVLADRDGVTFRVQGTCMYPTMRAGDVMRIQTCMASQVQVGDIAVCRAPGYLFSHRVIAKGEQDGRSYIITRPDRAHRGGDAPTFDDNLLGVVVKLTRNGKSVPLTPSAYPIPLQGYYAVRLAWIERAPRMRLALKQILARLQDHPLYRHIVRCILRAGFALTRPRILYSVRVPFASLGDAVYRQFTVDDFDPQVEWNGRPFEQWTLVLTLNGAREPAAWITYARDAGGTWTVKKMFVRQRYRGAGLDEALQRQAEPILSRDAHA